MPGAGTASVRPAFPPCPPAQSISGFTVAPAISVAPASTVGSGASGVLETGVWALRQVAELVSVAGHAVYQGHERYEGEWRDGREGDGRFSDHNGSEYTGQWKNDVQFGENNNYALSSGEEFMIDIPEGFPPGSAED